MDELRFFNPYAEIRHTGSRLLHWQQQGDVYFLTFRLADSIPARLCDQWENEREAWLKVHRRTVDQRNGARISSALLRRY
jgi:hypothetical protein